MSIKVETFRGAEAKVILQQLAALRIEVFKEFPYLYEGSLDYEKKYLERYFSSKKSIVVAVWDGETLVGASTAIYLSDEDPMIKAAVEKVYDPANFVYFGESILKKGYRGRGLGKEFFLLRENFARELGAEWVGFCAVIRAADDSRRNADYFSPEVLWTKLGYEKIPDLITEIEWKEIGEASESPKKLQFWTKELTR